MTGALLAILPNGNPALTEEVRTYLRGAFPDSPVLVLDQGGIAIYRAEAASRLDRIEAMLAVLLRELGAEVKA